MPPHFDATAMCLAMSLLTKSAKPTKRSTERCAKRVARGLRKIEDTRSPAVAMGVAGKSLDDLDRAELAIRRNCQSCGRCRDFGITQRP